MLCSAIEGTAKVSCLPLTYEQYDHQAELIQVNVGVGERAAEGGIDDHEEHTAADSTERRLRSFKPVLDVPSDDLKHRDQQVGSFQRCREWGAASQSDSDSGKTERKEGSLDDGQSEFQNMPATHSSSGELNICGAASTGVHNKSLFPSAFKPILYHAKCSLLAVIETCPLSLPKVYLLCSS